MKPLYLSASRIDTFLTCSQLYWAKYLAKLPDSGNDGSNRGNTVHTVLEHLAKAKHKHRYNDVVSNGSALGVPVVARLIRRLARQHGVADPANLKLIDGFIMVALANQFWGPPGTKEVLVERSFEIQVDEPGKRFNVRGFIDKVFVVLQDAVTYIEGTDYKTSQKRFEGDKLDHNMQSYIYQLALRRMFPGSIVRRFHFLFLKFKTDPVQEQPIFTDEQIDGFERQLSQFQIAMETFSDKNINDRLALHNEDKKWMCGREGTKKDGSPYWMCPAQKPLDYYVLLDEQGDVVDSAFTEDGLKPKDGQVVVPRHYTGCTAFYNPKTGARRNFS